MIKTENKIADLFKFQKKSSLKAGDGKIDGKFPFYTSSNKLSKYVDYCQYEHESLVFGTGGMANVHYSPGNFATSSDCFTLTPRGHSKVFPKYIYYYLSGNIHILEEGFKGAGLRHLSKEYISNLKVPCPQISEQKRIATLLDHADFVRQKNLQILEKYNELGHSLFYEIFGDPLINSSRFKSIKLGELSEIVSGVTKGRRLASTDLLDLPYMRVANVQDGYLNLDEIKKILCTKEELKKFRLKKDDILLTEGGDPDKLGRGAIWKEEIKDCIHQNHIFRVRVTSSQITPLYLNKLIGSLYGKNYFLKAGKQTTGIASINMTQLRNFPVLIPDKNLQLRFEQIISRIEEQQLLTKQDLIKSEELFLSLLQRAFKGEL